MVMEGDLAMGGEHTMMMFYRIDDECTDDVLQKCMLEMYNFINQCHSINSVKKEIKTSEIIIKQKVT